MMMTKPQRKQLERQRYFNKNQEHNICRKISEFTKEFHEAS